MDKHKTLFYKKLTSTSRKLTQTDQKIIDYLLRNYPACMLKNASEIAQDLSINVSTVTRYFQKIGYKSIRDAQSEFKEDVEFLISSPSDRFRLDKKNKKKENVFQKTLDNDFANIKNTFSGIKNEDLEQFCNLVTHQSGKVFILGEQSKTFALAFYLYAQLKFLIPNVYLLESDKYAIADSFATIVPQDTLIIFSFRRYLQLNRQIGKIFKRHGGRVITFTDSTLSPIAQQADLTFLIETKSVSPFDSYTAGISLINSLLGELSKIKVEFFSSKYKDIEQFYKELELF